MHIDGPGLWFGQLCSHNFSLSSAVMPAHRLKASGRLRYLPEVIWPHMASLTLPKKLRAAHHTEDGIHDDIDGDGGGLPQIPHGPYRFLVVGQEVI